MITLYILPGGTKEERERAIASFRTVEIAVKFIPMDCFNLYGPDEHGNDWFAFLYGYEFLDNNLREVLPLITQVKDYAFFIFMKRFIFKGEENISQAPRLFQRKVIMQPDCLMPVDLTLPWERILDGWVTQDAVLQI